MEANLGHNGDEGWETDYKIVEWIPPADSRSGPPDLAAFIQAPIDWEPHEFDPRNPTLALDLQSVNVHRVESVTFVAPPHSVSHYRWEKRDLDF